MKISYPALDVMIERLQQKARKYGQKDYNYVIPSLWFPEDVQSVGLRRIKVNPYSFFLGKLLKIREHQQTVENELWREGSIVEYGGGEWSKEAVIYNIFVRTTTAFDHNGNGGIDLPLNEDGFRETGTFLKSILLLPYIKSLGANTIHLLPITSVGRDGSKGSLGSPYAIRNPYELDEIQGEPSLGIDIKLQFKAFVEAAHLFGFRVVVEFVFRTSARDADSVTEHPEWYYWISESIQDRPMGTLDKSKYGSPIFTDEELLIIHQNVNAKEFGGLLPPHSEYRAMFTETPVSVKKINKRYVGTLRDGRNARIPGAFADWPPDDTQPPWSDVTYLKLYDHPDFNYIGYNTVRMYDTRLAKPENINASLWQMIIGIIPYYQREFAIDGVMIDMGHALPPTLLQAVVQEARKNDPSFAFWEENFSLTHLSREQGYNAAIGYCWSDQHHADKFKNLLVRLATEGVPIPFFATPESHNTPRAAVRPGGTSYSRWSWAVNNFLPAIPFIHSGFEIGETYPINTGLDFTLEELKQYPSEKLPLFSEYAYNWLNEGEFSDWVAKVSRLRGRFKKVITDQSPITLQLLETGNSNVISFVRTRIFGGKEVRILVVSNMNVLANEEAEMHLPTHHTAVLDMLSGDVWEGKEGKWDFKLGAGQCAVIQL
jgi:hypothetical protein